MKNKLAAFVLAAGLMGAFAPVAFAGDLNQTVRANEPVAPAGQFTEFTHGHADLGPLMVEQGEKSFDVLVRDDTQTPPVWRNLDDVTFVVKDNAKQTLPDTPDFKFVGANPGDKVWVVPQVEEAGVPWLGWSTQSPEFVNSAVRGVTMTFLGHQGQGTFTLFLQNGGFEKPQVLWNSADAHAQDMWVDLNTHTHANWVFTQPGIHDIAVKYSAEFTNGHTEDVIKDLTFAVGEGVDLSQAKPVDWEGKYLPEASTGEAESSQQSADSQWVLWAIIGVVGLVIVASLVVVFRALSARKES